MRFSVASALTAALLFVSASARTTVPAGKTTTPTTTTLAADQQAALLVHNKARAAKNIPALTWNPSLVTTAQACANKIAASGVFAHCQSGENLYAQSKGYSTTPLTAGAQAWINEAANYHGEVIPQGNFESYGHYTQAMWKNTKTIGIAQATGSNGWTYVVAHYDPVGNIVGQKPY